MNVPAVGRRFGPRAGALLGASAVALLFALVGQVGAAGATTVTVSLDVAGMTYWSNETHINPTCVNPITATQGRELHGTGQGGVGAFIADLTIPNGATLTSLTAVAHDNDTSFGADAYLVRKRMTAGTVADGLNGGFLTMAHSATSYPGASGGISRGSTTAISNPKVDTANFGYMAVVVNCHDTVDPIGVQVTYTHP